MTAAGEITGQDRSMLHLEEMVLNMGPQHPSTHGVLRLVLHLDGEMLISVDPVLGYLHRGFEKLAENRTYLQYLAMISRLDYLSGIFMEWSYVRSVEALMDIEVPKRAEYIRVIIGELNRIISHHVAIGDFMLNLGAVTPFFWVFRDREDVMDMLEMVTGQRMMYNFMRIGGVRWDLPDAFEADCRKFLKEHPAKIDDYEKLITDNEIFLARTLGMGIIKPYDALDYGRSGPHARPPGAAGDLPPPAGDPARPAVAPEAAPGEVPPHPVQAPGAPRRRRRIHHVLEIAQVGAEMADDEQTERERCRENRRRECREEQRDGRDQNETDEEEANRVRQE